MSTPSCKTPWPRLSETLPGPRQPDRCQACGNCYTQLQWWQEHDEQDRPEPVLVILCGECAKKLIEPHPRLYANISRHTPWPGAMDLCVQCAFRHELGCAHRDLKANGGPGLKVDFPEPSQAMVCGRGKGGGGCRQTTTYSGPPSSCAGRKEVMAP